LDEPAHDNVRVIQDVIDVFSKHQIPYALGGSWASSIHGKTRFTQDA